jgi:hypothetical protein
MGQQIKVVIESDLAPARRVDGFWWKLAVGL